MVHRQRPPQYTHTFMDSCAFSPEEEEEPASRRILEKCPNIIVAHSVQKELDHPNTPEDIRQLSKAFIYTIEGDLTQEEIERRNEIRMLIQGNAAPGRHKNDADHLFELSKYGGGYFVTTDRRLLKHSETLFARYFITTIKPSEYERLL